MKTDVSAELLAHLAGEVTTIAYCWTITRTDGEVFRFTDHDETITIGGYDYLASAGMGGTDLQQDRSLSVDNMEAVAFLDDDTITDADLRAGLFDGSGIDLFLVNWADTSMGNLKILSGWRFGQVEIRDAICTVEMRGLGSKLGTNICDLYSETCRADFGDAQCGVDLADSGNTQSGSVDSVPEAAPKQRFLVDSSIDMSDDQLVGGVLTWESGAANDGLSMEIRATDEPTGEITLFLPMPATIVVGDAFSIVRGCDKTFATCSGVFGNGVNFRGEPWVPANGKIKVFNRSSVRSPWNP